MLATRNPKARFVVLSHSRCGSTLLQSTLDSHPQAEVFGEVFHESQYDRAAFLGVRGHFYREGEDAAEFLREVVFGGSPHNVRAVGFKLMYYQARESDGSLRAWEMLRGDTEIHVVHLCRWNLLECFRSYEVACRSQQWYLPVHGEQRIDVPPFSIEPRRFIGFCESVLSWRAWAKRAFAEHPIIEVQYEQDLCHDFSEAMARIQTFLGLRRLSLRPGIRKQAVIPLDRQVTNFVELRAACRHTVGEEFF
jgi:LPS sulfotransferase NodH